MGLIKELVYRLRGEVTTEKLIKRGMKVGKNFSRQNNVILDPGHCWLIEIGDNVTLAPRVIILCHDASPQRFIKCTKVGKVVIGNNVFIGAGTVILPGVKIGDNVIVGANSTITKDIQNNSVVVGTPAKIISSTDEYLKKIEEDIKTSPCYGIEYTLYGGIDENKKKHQEEELSKVKRGYIK